jgi:uncharacterized protein YdaU (DUF1376 family)
MHYYQFNIKDYKAHTDHLSLMEDLAYRKMLDWCYLHECPLPFDVNEIAKRILMRTHNESIEFILNEFFIKTENGYENQTAKETIEAFREKSEKAKKSAKVRWDKKEDANAMPTDKEENANAMRTHSEGNANHKQRTINKEPLTNNHKQTTTNKEDQKPLLPKANDEVARAIFENWVQVMGKTAQTKFTPQRLQKIKARLKSGYTLSDINLAVFNCANNPFNMGQNEEGKVFDDLTLICRDDTKLEFYMNMITKPQNQTESKLARANREAAESFLLNK